MKVEISYEHIDILKERITLARLNDQEGMCLPVQPDIHDPRRLRKTIAPVDPKSTAVLQEEKVSHFMKKD